MNIISIDDDKIFLETLNKSILQYFEQHGMDYELELHSFSDAIEAPKSLLLNCDILFMDIYMPQSNGMELIKEWQDELHCQVVFITTSREHAVDAFQLDARHYLLKPIEDSAIDDALKRCLCCVEQESENPILEVQTGYSLTPVSINQIRYIEVFDKLSIIHTEKTKIQTYTSLSSLYNALHATHFMKPNRSFIVSMDYIQSFHSSHLILKNGEIITLSRQRRKELKEQYQKFLFDKARSVTL